MHSIFYLEELLSNYTLIESEKIDPLVITSLDLDIQQMVTDKIQNRLQIWSKFGATNAAALVVDKENFAVLAHVGSGEYFNQEHAGAIDYSKVLRSPGSTLKPFIYALALERGVVTPATILDDLHRVSDGVGNADDDFLGPLPLRMALANSRNVPAIELLSRVKLNEAYVFLGSLGLHDNKYNADYYGLGLAIGTMPVTLINLAHAYTVLADNGLLHDLRWFNTQPIKAPSRLLSQQTAQQLALFLADPLARLPSFHRMSKMEYPFAVALKTGTSNNYGDAWTIAWSNKYLVAVWLGHPDYHPMQGLTGATSAAVLVHDILTALHPNKMDGLSDSSFAPPVGYNKYKLCRLTGKLATDACDKTFFEWFRPGEEPVEHCDAHIKVAIDRRNGKLANLNTPTKFTVLKNAVVLPAKYDTWFEKSELRQSTNGVTPLSTRQYLERLRKPQNSSQQLVRPQIAIVSPQPNMAIIRDPESPLNVSTLALEAYIKPLPSNSSKSEIVWYIDGKLYQVASYPYSTRWPLQSGKHSFQAQIAFTDYYSKIIIVEIR
ncbi:MAG: hypothetical protein JW841_11540 [Deltaproteobacteria bacterium]|nr:hypothetical protein [Deltaproteobacteria bacterium]